MSERTEPHEDKPLKRVGLYTPNLSYRMAQQYIDEHDDDHFARLFSGLLNVIDFQELNLTEKNRELMDYLCSKPDVTDN